MTSQGPSSESPQQPRSRAFLVRLVAGLIVLAVAVVFMAENTRKVRVRALVPEVTAPLWAVLAATLVAGMLILMLVQRRRRRRRL